MDSIVWLLGWFLVGVFLEMLLLLDRRFSQPDVREKLFWVLVKSVGLAVVIVIRASFDMQITLNLLVSAWFVSLVCIYGWAFRREILRGVNEETLFSCTLVFWYVMLVNVESWGGYWYFVFLFASIPSSFALVNPFIKEKQGYKMKLLLYSWYLIIVIVLLYSQFSFGDSPVLNNDFVPEGKTALDMLLTGMVSLYLGVNVFYVFSLIRDDYKNPEEKKNYEKLLVSKYLDYELTRKQSLILLLIEAGLLIGNYYLKIVSDYLLVNFILLFMSQIFTGRKIPSKTTT
jgi:hypothetical protein